MSRDHAKLRSILDMLNPGLIYACDGAKFAPALRSVDMHGAQLATDSGEAQEGLPVISFGELLATPGGAQVDRAFAAVGADSIAKILFQQCLKTLRRELTKKYVQALSQNRF